MRITALFAVLMVALPASVSASYDRPSRAYGLNLITSVVDATVTEYNNKGHARIHLHHILVGESPPKAIVGAIYTCMDSTPRAYNVQEGHRYVFLLVGDRLFEEQSFFPVSVNEAGMAFVQLGFYKDWFGLPNNPVALLALKQYLHDESAKARADSTIREKALAARERWVYFYKHQQEYVDRLRRRH